MPGSLRVLGYARVALGTSGDVSGQRLGVPRAAACSSCCCWRFSSYRLYVVCVVTAARVASTCP